MTTAPTTTRPPLLLRVLVVFLAATAIWILLVWLNAKVAGGALNIPARVANAALISALVLPLVVGARRALDRRSWRGLGLQRGREGRRAFLIGLLAFLLPSALGLAVTLASGWVTLEARVPMATILGWAALLVVIVFFSEALPEELLFRGYLQRNLTTALAPLVAAIVQAVLFTVFGTALWVATEGWGVLAERGLMFLAMGVLLGLLRIQTGSVWTPVGFHLAFQVVAQSLLGDRVATDNEAGLLLGAVVSAFVLGTTVVSLLHKPDANWSRSEPE